MQSSRARPAGGPAARPETGTATGTATGAEIGIVVPAYDASRWLARTVASLTRQTDVPWRCVIVDDGSRDDTLLVARELAAADDRVQVHAQRNAGVSAARNAGTALLPAGISHVAYVDSDDVMLAGALGTLHRALLARPDAVGAYGLAEYVDGDGEPLLTGEHPRRQRDRRKVNGRRLVDVGPTADCGFDELVVNSPIWPPAVAVVRREIVDAVGGWDQRFTPQEDWELFVRMSRRGPFVALDEQVAQYRRHDANASGRVSELVRVQAAVRHRIWRDPGNSPAQRRAVARAWRYLRAREAALLVGEARGAAGARGYRAASRAMAGAAVAATQTLLSGPPGDRLALTGLATTGSPAP